MECGCLFTPHMENRYTDACQDIGDQAAVTAPPKKLRAHENSTLPVSEHQNFIKPRRELLGRHVVGVGAKCRMPPSQIRRRCARLPATAEVGDPAIENSVAREIVRERVSAELRKT